MDNVTYYAYSRGTTTEMDESHEPQQNRLLVDQIINQWDSGVKYPGTNKSAFTDKDFLAEWCNKQVSDSTIARVGCAICCVASFVLHKTKVACTNDNIFQAVEMATKNATDASAGLNPGCDFDVSVGNETVKIQMMKLTDTGAYEEARKALREGKKCVICMKRKDGKSTHFVLADGYNDSASNMFDWFLVCDPDGGVQRTLREAIEHRKGKNHSTDTDTFTYRIIW